MIKRCTLEITSTPFSILTSEIDMIKQECFDWSYFNTERDQWPDALDIEEDLKVFHSRFNEFRLDPESSIEDRELGLIEFVWRNENEWIKFTFYFDDIAF